MAKHKMFTHRVSIAMTKPQYEKYKALAELNGLTMNAFYRLAAMRLYSASMKGDVIFEE